ncbi:MAG: RHS repeat domain-containing protein, partial [Arenimonas sp.]
ESTTYENAASGQPYPVPIGTSPQPRNDAYTAENLRPQRSHSTIQDGVTFSRTVTAFDRFARAISATQASSLGYSRDEATTYEDNTASWVLGQTKTSSLAGKITTNNVYDPTTALLSSTLSFGLLQYSLGYNADGTLRTFTDPRNFTTTLSDWYRGRPRNIAYPNSTAQAAAVNGQGWLTAVTDELGTTTAYGYDALGRLSLVDYTNADTVLWNDTTRSFVPVPVAEYGLPAGHWKQTVATGNGQSTTFYDAQWRPVLTMSEDISNASSRSFVVNRYDAAGRMVFTSYPVGTLTSISDALLGTTSLYDALGRVTKVKQDSELGVLTSSTEYLPGFQTRTTNPRGFQTVTSYQVFDSPDSSRPVLIQAPEGATTTIVRDSFGKPQQITRSGN